VTPMERITNIKLTFLEKTECRMRNARRIELLNSKFSELLGFWNLSIVHFTYGIIGRQKMVSKHSSFTPTHWSSQTCCWLGLLHQISTSFSILRMCMLFRKNFILHFPDISHCLSLYLCIYVAVVVLT
jgi:hypothetical protein